MRCLQLKNADQLSGEIAENIKRYRDGFDKAFSAAFSAYEKLREEKQKKEIRHVYICYLRSSVTQALPLFRIDLYDEADTEDIDDCAVDWDVPFSSTLYKEFPLIAVASTGDAKRILLAEQLMFEEAERFFSAMKDYMSTIIDGSWRQMLPDVQWHYGEYLDSCDAVL